jgi:glutathione S-transferase
MSLHNKIMNLEARLADKDHYSLTQRSAFRMGHKQARHAAAELGLAADARIAELEAALAALVDRNWMVMGQQISAADVGVARAALQRKDGAQ